MTTIRPHLWYHDRAHEAAEFYTGLFPDSRITSVVEAPPGNGELGAAPEGTPFVVEFTIAGQPVVAMSAGDIFTLNEAFSFAVQCDTQEEADRYWEALTADGGEESQCGWCKDRFGLSWQIVPKGVDELTMGADEASARARAAMYGMRRLDLAALQAAYDGA